jgi:hypothetical protein
MQVPRKREDSEAYVGLKKWRCGIIKIKDYFIEEKKSTTFFQARISRCGKGRVSDFLGHEDAELKKPALSDPKSHARCPVYK